MLRDILLRNFWVKLLSVTLATVIWFSIKYGIQADLDLPPTTIISPVESSTPISVNTLTQPGDARIFEVTPKDILVTVRAESALLRKYSRQDFKAYVDLTEIRGKEQPSYEVRVHVPSGLTVLKIVPEAVTVEQISP